MKALIFSEGNGYGHASRDKLISEHFDFPLMTFGKGAEFCRKNNMEFIEIPTPYVIKTGAGVKFVSDVNGIASFMKQDVLATIISHFRRVDLVIVDGTPLGLGVAMLAGKKSIYITNDTAALVGVHGVIEKKIANSLLKGILRSTKAIIVPDFPPPLSITLPNLNTTFPLTFSGPLTEKTKQKKHGKKVLVSGILANEIRPYLGTDAIYGDESDFNSCYEDCGVVVSHGGHTTIMESLSYGKPIINIVEKDYSERLNNALTLERKDVGVLLEKNLLNKETLLASINYAQTLNKKRLDLYRKTAEEMNPMSILEGVLSKL